MNKRSILIFTIFMLRWVGKDWELGSDHLLSHGPGKCPADNGLLREWVQNFACSHRRPHVGPFYMLSYGVPH